MKANNVVSRANWRGVSISVRQEYMAQAMHIHHPDFVRAVTKVKRRKERCKNEKKGQLVIILSPSGAGKTHLRKFLKDRWPNKNFETITHVPVIDFDTPTAPSRLTMGQALLRSIDYDPVAKKADDVLASIFHLLPKIQTELIIIDDVHDIPEKRRAAGIQEIGGWVRRLVDKLNCLVVLLGTPAARGIITPNGQIRRRGSTVIEMDYFHYDDPASRARFNRFLQQIDEKLPLAESSQGTLRELAEHIFHSTFGISGFIFQLFVEALGSCVSSGRERIERSDFETAFSELFEDAAKGVNPFIQGIKPRPLTGDGEPFFNWYDASNPSLKRHRP